MTAPWFDYPYEALNYVRAKILADGDIDAFCQATYGKSVSVFIGLNELDLPSEDSAPYVILERGTTTFSTTAMGFVGVTQCTMLAVVYDEGTINDGRGIIYKGVSNLDLLCLLLKRAIKADFRIVEESVPRFGEEASTRRAPLFCQLITFEMNTKEA